MTKKLLFISLFILIVALYNVPSFATFQIDDFAIDANVLPDGSMNVKETISYYTDEVVNGLTRNIEIENPSNPRNSASDVTVKAVRVDGVEYEQTSNAAKGDSGVYTLVEGGTSSDITLYSPFSSEYKIVEYEYTLSDVAVKYDDTAEIFWNFLGIEWDCYIGKLTVNIHLPEIAARDTIWVYGHGSDYGTFDKVGNNITLNVDSIPAYNAIDARILFSRDSISDSTKIVNKSVLENYIDKEEGMSKKLEAKKVLLGFSVEEIAIGLDILIVVVGFFVYIFFDKEIRVEKVKYFREMPYNLEPEVLQYIYYRKTVSNSFYIAVLNLVKLGVYKLENTVNKVGKETQRIIYNPDHTAKLKEYQSKMVTSINGFLEKDSEGRKSLDMVRLASKMSRSTASGYRKYQDGLKQEKEGLVGKPSKVPGKIIVCTGFVMAALILFIVLMAIAISGFEIAIGLAMFLGLTTIVYSVFFTVMSNFLPGIIFICFHAGCFQIGIIAMMVECGVVALYPTYLMMFALIQYVIRVKKYPKEERQIIEYVKGLKRYIKHYSMLNEKEEVTENIALWEDYFIMAIALGLNSKTINYFYNYGKEQNTNLGIAMGCSHSYSHFHHDMYTSCYNYQKQYTTSSSGGSSYGGSSHSGSSGGFSGGSSSGGGRRRWWRRKPFLKNVKINKIQLKFV